MKTPQTMKNCCLDTFVIWSYCTSLFLGMPGPHLSTFWTVCDEQQLTGPLLMLPSSHSIVDMS